jgi:predicted metallo-beta-lactamase superfamily hydrolase
VRATALDGGWPSGGGARPWPEKGKNMVVHRSFSSEKKMRWEIDETVMDSRKQVYHGEENDEGYLLVVVVDART